MRPVHDPLQAIDLARPVRPLSSLRRWISIGLVIAAGVIAAFQVGKAAVAIPLLRQDMGLGLVAAGLLVSLYGGVGAIAGLPLGLFSTRVRAKPLMICGLAAIAAGSAAGSLAGSAESLLASRIVEGAGFIAIGLAAPRLIRAVAELSHRDVALALWGTYMPIGSAAMMLAAPALGAWGWRGLWAANAAIAAAYAIVVWAAVPAARDDAPSPAARLACDLGKVLKTPAAGLIALSFGLYTFHYAAIAGLLPLLLVDRLNLTIAQAGIVGALTVIANAVGNLVAGILLGLRVPFWAVVAVAFVCLGLCALGIFATSSPVVMVAILASISLAVTGLVPASSYAVAGHAVPSALIGVALGLIIQSSNIGHFLGPAVLGWWVSHFGWSSAGVLFVGVACLGLAAAFGLRSALRHRPTE